MTKNAEVNVSTHGIPLGQDAKLRETGLRHLKDTQPEQIL
jgi:hypothetical protein